MGHQNNQITIKDILSKHDNMYDVLLSMQLNLFPLSSLDLVDVDNEKQYGSYYAFSPNSCRASERGSINSETVR